MAKTSIEWTARFGPDGQVMRTQAGEPVTGFTWNGWWGCYQNSPACDHCYAKAIAAMYGRPGLWGKNAPRWFPSKKYENDPMRWNAAAEAEGVWRNVFAFSMGDWAEWRADLVAPRLRWLLTVQNTPALTWLTLTKFAGLIRRHLPGDWTPEWPGNVRIGFTGEDQRHFDSRWRHVGELAADGWPVFVSIEPILGPVNLPNTFLELGGRAWVIGGGESGAGARAWDLRHVRRLRDQAAEARVPFFWKQNGGMRKGDTGRLLDGREWNGQPDPTPAAVRFDAARALELV